MTRFREGDHVHLGEHCAQIGGTEIATDLWGVILIPCPAGDHPNDTCCDDCVVNVSDDDPNLSEGPEPYQYPLCAWYDGYWEGR